MITLLVLAVAVVGCGVTTSCTDKGGSVDQVEKLDRGTFYVSVEEIMEGQKTEDSIANVLLTKQMLLHGFTLVDSPEKAQYLITGKADYTYFRQVTFDFGGTSQHLEHQFKAVAEITLTDQNAPEDSELREEFFDIPDPGPEKGMTNGRTERNEAQRDIRRKAVTSLSRRLLGGKMLERMNIKKLEYALGDPFEPRTFNDIIAAYIDIGAAAVPYLLELMLDDRPVKLKGDYPGLTEENKDELKYYHIADKALAEILMRRSGLAIDSSEEYYQKVHTGWFWAWEDEQDIPAKYRTRPAARKKTVPAPVGDVPED